MDHPHDLIWLFTRFWWLIFPLFWMGMAMMGIWSRHNRANRSLDLLKSYADQGKDPPPELLKTLQGGSDWGGWCGPRYGRYSRERLLNRFLLFSALAAVFGFIVANNLVDGDYRHHGFGLLIPLAVFTALALGNGLSLFLWRDPPPPPDQNGPPR